MFIVAILHSYTRGRHYGFTIFTRDSQSRLWIFNYSKKITFNQVYISNRSSYCKLYTEDEYIETQQIWKSHSEHWNSICITLIDDNSNTQIEDITIEDT